jgi:hypothetical protein
LYKKNDIDILILFTPLLQTGSFSNTIFQEGFADSGVFTYKLVAGIFCGLVASKKNL